MCKCARESPEKGSDVSTERLLQITCWRDNHFAHFGYVGNRLPVQRARNGVRVRGGGEGEKARDDSFVGDSERACETGCVSVVWRERGGGRERERERERDLLAAVRRSRTLAMSVMSSFPIVTCRAIISDPSTFTSLQL